MAAPSPHWDQADWDQLTINGVLLPGVWVIEGSADRRLDIKPRKNSDGAVIKDQGYQNADISLIGELTTKEEYEDLQKALKDIHPRRKGAARDPLAINHPAITSLGVEAVYVTSIAAPTLRNGILTQLIKVLEWTQQPKPTPKRKPFPKLTGGAGLGDVRRQFRGMAYGGPSGIEHIDTGTDRPSADTDWTADQIENDQIFADLATQLGQ